MDMISVLLTEMQREFAITRKMLERIPDGSYDYKPHEKNMLLERLAVHIAELPTWVSMALDTTELDFAAGSYNPKSIRDTQSLLAYAEECYNSAHARLGKATEQDLLKPWTLRNGEVIYSTEPVLDVIRMAYNQIVHHRAQLGLYLRLQNIPIPGSYGPSADEKGLF